jgi:hypothetical protein
MISSSGTGGEVPWRQDTQFPVEPNLLFETVTVLQRGMVNNADHMGVADRCD